MTTASTDTPAPRGNRRVLAGPAFTAGPEAYADHLARLGAPPSAGSARWLIPTLEASGLLGRGGAGFPVGRKWRSVAERAAGSGAVVLVNGAEGEPLSFKDQAVMAFRPHLVLDGAELAAAAVGADEIVLYVGEGHTGARRAIEAAIAERRGARRRARGSAIPARLVLAPPRYVAGEETAAVHAVNDRDPRPTTKPPRPFERGVRGLPTLVQNVESLAQAALIARFGDGWYREAGRGEARGTMLVTLTRPDARPAIHEVELGTSIGEVVALAGDAIRASDVHAVLMGGYFGGWLRAAEAWDTPLDPVVLARSGRSVGSGVVSLLPAGACPVVTTARLADYLAGQSAAQCGPCVFGLRSIADATIRIARRKPAGNDLARIERWAGQVRDRGACRFPDGAVNLLASGLDAFAAEFALHQRAGRCSYDAGPSRRADGGSIAELVA